MRRSGRLQGRVPREALLDWGLAAAMFLLPLAVYWVTMAPALLDADSGEFQTNIYKLGVSHTGYPLFFLMAKVWTVLLPVGSIAWRATLFSAAMGAVASALLYVTTRVFLGSRPTAVLTAAAFSLSRVEWSQAVIPDVYTLNSALGILVLLAFILWRAGRLDLRAAVFCYGLSLTHHRMMIWFAPALAVFVLAQEGWSVFRPRRLIGLVGAFLFPLLIYAYVPLRGDSDVGVEYHPGNNVNVLALNVFYDLRLQPAFLWARVGTTYLPLLIEQFTPVGLALGLLGLAGLLLNRPPRGMPAALPARATGVLLLLAHLMAAAFGVAFWVVDSEIFFLPAYLTFVFFVAAGVTQVLDWAGRWSIGGGRVAPVRALLVAAGAAGLGLLAVHNWPSVNLSTQDEAQTRWEEILAQPLEESALVAGPWEALTPLEYNQYVEGRRTDLKRIKLVLFKDQLPLAGKSQNAGLAAASRAVMQGQAVYLTVAPSQTETLGGWASKFALVPVGSLVRVLSSVEWMPAQREGMQVGKELVLDEAARPVGAIRAGDLLPLRLSWRAVAPDPSRYRFILRLRDAEGRTWWQEEREPNGGQSHTDGWQMDQVEQDLAGILLPPDMPPGEYQLELGAREEDSGAAIRVGDGAFGTLMTVQIEPPAEAPALVRLNIPQPQDAGFGTQRLRGAGLEQTEVGTGDRLTLSLWWQGASAPDGRNTHARLVLGDTELESFKLPDASATEIVRQKHTPQIPLTLAPATLPLILEGNGAKVRLATVRVTASGRTLAAPAPKYPAFARVGGGIDLAGYDLDRTQARPGESVRVTLYWATQKPLGASYAVFVHLLDEGGQLRAQSDGVPRNGALPTDVWMAGEYVRDEHVFKVPADLPPGRYQIEVGMYQPETGARLDMVNREGAPLRDNRLLLDQAITVTR